MKNNNISHNLDVIFVLAQKDFKLRYRNSVLGFLWSLLNPLAYMLILTIVFSLLLRVNVPNFAAWVLIGLLIWRFFSLGTSQGLFSIVNNPSLVTNVYLPRYLIVLSNNLANLFGALLEFIIFIPLLFFLGVTPTIFLFFLPVIIVLEFLLIFGLSLSLASLNVKYRDFFQLWEVALQLGFFLSPIVYDSQLIPSRFRFAYSLNPVTGLIEFARDIFVSQRLPSIFDLTLVTVAILIFLGVGVTVFRSLEDRLAEEI
jgi:lipopolysaccharide transport system permease protein